MNNVDKQYLDIAVDILANGVRKKTRSGEVLSVFDRTMRFNLRDGLPLLTTKKVFTKGCIIELLWFLKGDTNIKYLIDNGVNIWTDDAYRYYKELCVKHNAALSLGRDTLVWSFETKQAVTKDEFILGVKAKTLEPFVLYDEDKDKLLLFSYRYGDLGEVYGKQWRRFGQSGFDQIQNIIDTMRTNPDDRRMMCTALNPDVLCSVEGCALPPCHTFFQFWTRELSVDERMNLLPREELENASDDWTSRLDALNVPKRELSLSFYCRSQDLPLGTPFNILSYSVLQHMVCKLVNMIPGELIYHGGDCHIYTNQIEGIQEQLSRTASENLPVLSFREGKEYKEITDFEYEDIIISGYDPAPPIKFPLSVG